MKTVILAGGLGTRLSEETYLKPKPMVEIGQSPILWHIMKRYEKYNFNDFIISLGYKGEYINQYFLNYNILFYLRFTLLLTPDNLFLFLYWSWRLLFLFLFLFLITTSIKCWLSIILIIWLLLISIVIFLI